MPLAEQRPAELAHRVEPRLVAGLLAGADLEAFARRGLGLRPPLRIEVSPDQVVGVRQRLGVLGARPGVAELYELLEDRDGLAGVSGGEVCQGQVAPDRQRLRVLGAELP